MAGLVKNSNILTTLYNKIKAKVQELFEYQEEWCSFHDVIKDLGNNQIQCMICHKITTIGYKKPL